MRLLQRNSSICTLGRHGGFLVGARDTLSVVSLCRDQGELTYNRPPRPAVCHGVSWSWTLASFAPEFGAADALRAQGDGARGVLDVLVPLSIPERRRGPPVPSARSICAMSTALERGLWPGVVGCLSTRTFYDQFSFSHSAINLALVTFAVERMIFLVSEGAWSVSHSPWPVIRQEFPIPENALRQCKDRPWLILVDIR